MDDGYVVCTHTSWTIYTNRISNSELFCNHFRLLIKIDLDDDDELIFPKLQCQFIVEKEQQYFILMLNN